VLGQLAWKRLNHCCGEAKVHVLVWYLGRTVLLLFDRAWSTWRNQNSVWLGSIVDKCRSARWVSDRGCEILLWGYLLPWILKRKHVPISRLFYQLYSKMD